MANPLRSEAQERHQQDPRIERWRLDLKLDALRQEMAARPVDTPGRIRTLVDEVRWRSAIAAIFFRRDEGDRLGNRLVAYLDRHSGRHRRRQCLQTCLGPTPVQLTHFPKPICRDLRARA